MHALATLLPLMPYGGSLLALRRQARRFLSARRLPIRLTFRRYARLHLRWAPARRPVGVVLSRVEVGGWGWG